MATAHGLPGEMYNSWTQLTATCYSFENVMGPWPVDSLNGCMLMIQLATRVHTLSESVAGLQLLQ